MVRVALSSTISMNAYLSHQGGTLYHPHCFVCVIIQTAVRLSTRMSWSVGMLQEFHLVELWRIKSASNFDIQMSLLAAVTGTFCCLILITLLAETISFILTLSLPGYIIYLQKWSSLVPQCLVLIKLSIFILIIF